MAPPRALPTAKPPTWSLGSSARRTNADEDPSAEAHPRRVLCGDLPARNPRRARWLGGVLELDAAIAAAEIGRRVGAASVGSLLSDGIPLRRRRGTRHARLLTGEIGRAHV